MSVVFDRATSFYDQTRGLPKAIEDWLTDSVPNEVGLVSGSRVLEIGVGTGRIARPLARAGYRYPEVDLSYGMMLNQECGVCSLVIN
jgi:ubiquinone/menaquinone biosynthesis C-methylase UbiE